MLYVRVSSFVVLGCAVSRRYINACNCDIFSVVNVCLDHWNFCVVFINGQRYVCYSECNVVSNECNEPTHCLVRSIGMHSGEVIYFGSFCFRGELGFLNCYDICMCVVNFDSVYGDLKYVDFYCCACVVVLGLSVMVCMGPYFFYNTSYILYTFCLCNVYGRRY